MRRLGAVVTLLVACLVAGDAAGEKALVGAPLLFSEQTTAITDTTATVAATAIADDEVLGYAFEYGETTAYGRKTDAVVLDSFDRAQRLTATLTGLAPGTRYHWRAVAATPSGTSFGEGRSFTTDGEKAQGKQDPAPPTSVPPRQGELVVASRARGRVRVKTAGGRYTTLDAATGIPMGSVIDARRGRVRLVSAIDAAGTTQTASFRDGQFEIRTGDAGTLELHLRGGSFRKRCGLARASSVARDVGRRVVRRLWGSDRSGRYRMHGRNSVATVRGTRWEVVDRCGGTLTRVHAGTVDVRDGRTGRTVRVRAGHSYLARAR
jgi:hypothetical protein